MCSECALLHGVLSFMHASNRVCHCACVCGFSSPALMFRRVACLPTRACPSLTCAPHAHAHAHPTSRTHRGYHQIKGAQHGQHIHSSTSHDIAPIAHVHGTLRVCCMDVTYATCAMCCTYATYVWYALCVYVLMWHAVQVARSIPIRPVMPPK